MLCFALGCAAAPPAISNDAKSQNQIQWEKITSWSGRGSQRLDSFPSEGALRIEWETKAMEGATTPATFKVVIHSAISGRPLGAPVIDQRGEGKGTAYFSEEPRMFFLDVSSEGLQWKVTVSERVR